MKNNRGFTLIEFAVSFCLIATISILLFQIIIGVKELYITGDVKTTLLNRQAIMTRKIYDSFATRVVSNVKTCGEACLTFTYTNGTTAEFKVDAKAKTISFDGYVITALEGTTIGTFTSSLYQPVGSSLGLLEFQVPLTNKLTEGDYGIHIIFQYKPSVTTVTL